jgi:hypothetical protein
LNDAEIKPAEEAVAVAKEVNVTSPEKTNESQMYPPEFP